MLQPSFIHLRVHSEYSVLEGAVRVKSLPRLAAEHAMPAVALTDTNAMFAALEFSEGAAKAGVQPIMGAQIDLEYVKAAPGAKAISPAPVVLLAQDEAGYLNLLALQSLLYLTRTDREPQVTLDDLASHAAGLICLTGGPDGPTGRLLRTRRRPQAEALMRRLADTYPGRLYVELQRHPGEDGLPEAEALSERGHVEMAYAMDLPLVATNDVYFPDAEMFEAHDAFLCVAQGAYVDQNEPRRQLTPEHWFKSGDQMRALFADLPEACDNTVEIARRCAHRPRLHDPILPRFADDEVDELRRQSREGLAARLEVIPHAAPAEEYGARLEYELGVIERMGYPGYFLIVADFIQWAKGQNIPVGPGRGSGAGSLVAYALTITDLDPLRYGLLFERFLNPDRVSMPDFDIDFCMDRREEVIRYVQRRYGEDRVGQIITFGALLSKAAVRDVGRVLQMPFGQCDQLSKMVPLEGVKPVPIPQALRMEPRLAEEAKKPVVRTLLDHCTKLEGLLRNASTHAAGVVIGDRPLDQLVPLYRDPRSDMPATQFNMKWVEQAGLVKFDFLGLKTLTMIRNALDLLEAKGTPVDLDRIPLDDERAYALYASGKTTAVFQVESSGMIDALRRMRPTTVEDIIALVALYRPGPMENIPQYCDVKNGRAPRAKLHPSIDHILDETQGIIVYQEQVMEIAREMAGYSLGEADLLRRAMGKKIQAEMDAQRPLFLRGAQDRGVPEAKAMEVWNLLDKFANYGFNKSHAAAYGLISYQTAWLKANHPVEYMAGVMNCDIHLTDKLGQYAEDVRRNLRVEIVPPCVNRASALFTTEGARIVYGLGALKNVGIEAMRLIEQARGAKPFATLFDLARRVDLKRVGKRPLEMVARAGGFDQLDGNRRRVMESLDALTAYSAAVHADRASAQVSLFGEAGDDLPEPRLPAPSDWLPAERLAEEHAAVGFYLSGHPLDDHMGPLTRRGVLTYAALEERAKEGPLVAKVAGSVAHRQERISSKGNRFAFLGLSDPTGVFEAMVFSEVLGEHRAVLEPGAKVVVTVEATLEADQLKLLVRDVVPVEGATRGAVSGLRIFVEEVSALDPVSSLLERLSSDAPGAARADIALCLKAEGLPGEVEVSLGEPYPVSPDIRSALRSVPGVVMVEEG